ncbi:diguanylate cyclase (GGDEF) domain-containing protein [Alkalispirochaeta americana]|uniref:diguanylate cyclase n=1 Tax=Alkalispirochaeta americana TaxID=159291 RepID=A0A1N6WIT8_9SPIO|nr:diguanylate cyclase [Alkalispirochaeta americana]SIQ89954.1 diguanylate cyclase (GGDEF) domain-containing protein [Alkalispirochaeta americana]
MIGPEEGGAEFPQEAFRNSPETVPEGACEAATEEILLLRKRIATLLTERPRAVRLPAELEQRFEEETGDERSRYLVLRNLVALVLINFFLFSDRFMIPDMMVHARVVRLGLITPAGLAVTLMIRRGVAPAVREFFVELITVMSGLGVLYLVLFSRHPNAVYYHHGLILVLAYANNVVVLRFRAALAVSVLLSLLYIGAIPFFAIPLPLPVAAHYTLSLVATAGITLLANHGLEQGRRYSYLVGLRERLRGDALAADNTRLAELSRLDPLTGIANRRGLLHHLEEIWNDSSQRPVGIVVADVDFFKPYNDCYGHVQGDICLKRIAGTLRAALRHQGDLVARFGGEEFVVVLPGTSADEAFRIAERMLRNVQELAIPHQEGGDSGVVTISAGVSAGQREDGRPPLEIIEQADQALYRAKEAGRNRVSCLDPPAASASF